MVTKPLPQTRLSRTGVTLILLALITPCASAAGPKRVLILDPFENNVAPFSAVSSAFRATLTRESGERVEVNEVQLDLARFADAEEVGPLVAFLGDQIKQHPPDLVVPIGGPGAGFVAQNRETLFPDLPVLLLGAQPRSIPPGFLRTNATLVTQRVDLPGIVEDILQMQPQTTNVAVVFGSSPQENFWVNECRREFQPFTSRVRFTWLNGLSLPQVLERCAALPPRSFILHGLFVVDADGVPCVGNDALRQLHQKANAPVFGYYTSEFGLGSIGGRLFRDSEIGVQGARIAMRILHGESPRNIPPQVIEAGAPVYDWRELQRWGISEARLPAGSVIRFRQPGVWEHYRLPITGAVLLGLLQAGLIIGLLVNRAKRRRGEAEATLIADISSRFVNLPPGEVDGQILDAERLICEFLGLDRAVLWQWSKEAPPVLTPTHVYTKEGQQGPGQRRQEHYPWFVQELLAGRTVAVSSLKDLPAEAADDRENCRLLGIKSNLTIPLSVGGESAVGVLGFNTLRKERDWPDALVKSLQLVAQIFANALARKHADQVLHESEELNRATFEQAAVGMAHVGIDGRWLRVNSRLCAIVGYPPEELLALTFQAITHPEDLEPDLNFAARILSGEIKSYSMEKRYIRKDRSVVRVMLTVSLVRTAAGAPLHFIAVVEDITERRQAEMEAQELHANLAHAGRVTLLGQLASALAHELSQPLGAILRNAEAAEIILQKQSPDLEELRAIVTDILGDDQRAGLVIDRLRSLLKRRRVDLQPVELPGVISEVLSLVRANATARHLKLDYSPAQGLPMVRGDRIHLHQVLLNLIINAMDALDGCPPNRPCVQVRARRRDPATVEVRVSDNGPGIPGESLERLFEPFFTTKANGMGMGLPVSKTLVEAHGGRLWAENGPGGGACFCFTLPVADPGGAP
jgi:PAS domain S-box-containing protein